MSTSNIKENMKYIVLEKAPIMIVTFVGMFKKSTITNKNSIKLSDHQQSIILFVCRINLILLLRWYFLSTCAISMVYVSNLLGVWSQMILRGRKSESLLKRVT